MKKLLLLLAILTLTSACSTLSMASRQIDKLGTGAAATIQKFTADSDRARDYATAHGDSVGAACFEKNSALLRAFPVLEPEMGSCPACLAEHVRLVTLWKSSPLHEETMAACSPFLGVLRRLVLFR